MPDYIQRWKAGPYGTNEGDIWSVEDSPVGQRILNEHGGVLIHEMLRMPETNEVEERIYWVKLDNPDMKIQDLIKRAREGTKLWIEARAREN